MFPIALVDLVLLGEVVGRRDPGSGYMYRKLLNLIH